MARKKQISEEIKEKVREMYKATDKKTGETKYKVNEIIEKFPELNAYNIYQIIREKGDENLRQTGKRKTRKTTRKASEEEKEKLIERYLATDENGEYIESAKSIIESLPISKNAFYNILKEKGVDLRRPNMSKNKLSYEDKKEIYKKYRNKDNRDYINNEKITAQKLGDEYGVSAQTVLNVCDELDEFEG